MYTMKRTGPVLVKLFRSSSSNFIHHNYSFWTCGHCHPAAKASVTGLVEGSCSSYSTKSGQRGRKSITTSNSTDETELEDLSKKGRSKIVLQNWDRHYEEVRRKKQAKQLKQEKTQQENILSSVSTEDIEEDDMNGPQKPKQVPPDLSDEFGSLTIGDTGVPVSDTYSKMTKEQLKELEASIYSIDQPEEEDDAHITLDDRMNFRQLKIRTKALLRDGRFTEALDLFTHEMKMGGRRYDMQDLNHTYSELIAECGRAGHIKMALQLFKEMKERGLYVQPSVYTNLFNGFANSVGDREDNIEKLEKVKHNMLEKGFEPNIIHYHCLMKAYGRLGEIQAAFSVVDEMAQKSISGDPNPKARRKIKLETETFNFLFSACITDKQNGFRHSLATWKKMIGSRIAPDHYSFKLFLRSVRECGIVVPKSVRKLLGELTPYIQNQLADTDEPGSSQKSYLIPGTDVEFHDVKSIPPLVNSESGFEDNCTLILADLVDDDESKIDINLMERTGNDLGFSSQGSELINLLRNSCTPSRGVQTLLQFPHNRLAILGGLKAIVTEMRNFNVRPDIKTLTELVQIVHPRDIQNLMFLLSENKVKPDTDFFNLIMKRYIMWDQQQEARNVLKIMHQHRLHPNIMTWGIFSLACKDWSSAKRLLKDIDSYKMEPNIQILGGLLGTAIRNFDSRYVLRVMEEVGYRELDPDVMFVEKIINFRTVVQKGLVNHEQEREVTPFPLQNQLKDNYDHFMDYFGRFKLRYHSWMKAVPQKVLAKVRNPEDIEDPWEEDYKKRMDSLKTAQQN